MDFLLKLDAQLDNLLQKKRCVTVDYDVIVLAELLLNEAAAEGAYCRKCQNFEKQRVCNSLAKKGKKNSQKLF